MTEKRKRGFAVMDREKQREIASKGGRAAHLKGTAHEFNSEEAREAGRKGGLVAHRRGRLSAPQESGDTLQPGDLPERPVPQLLNGEHSSAAEINPTTQSLPTSSPNAIYPERNAAMTQQTRDMLDGLIVTCTDRQYGYRTAAESVRDSTLRSLFRSYEYQSAGFVNELTDELRRQGGDPETRGSVTGWLMRGWMNVKSALTGNDEAAIVAECERGDGAAMSNYDQVLQSPLPASLQSLLRRQYIAIRESHDRMRAMELSEQVR